MKTLVISLVLSLTLCAVSLANAAEKGAVIARKDLPASMTAKVKADAKFPGVPSCAKGRTIVTTWPESVTKDGHPCQDANDLYVCAAFGKISVKCEKPSK